MHLHVSKSLAGLATGRYKLCILLPAPVISKESVNIKIKLRIFVDHKSLEKYMFCLHQRQRI